VNTRRGASRIQDNPFGPISLGKRSDISDIALSIWGKTMSRISGQARRAIIASTVATLTLGAAHANVFVTYSDAYSVAAEAFLLNTITGTASKAEPTLGAPVELADSESIAIASADFSNGIPSIADPYAEISITPTLPKGAASVTFQASAEVEYAFSIKQATFGPQPSTIKVDVIGSFEGGDATMVTTASVSVLNQNQIPLASENEYQNNFNPLPGSPFVSSPFTLTVDVIPGAVYESPRRAADASPSSPRAYAAPPRPGILALTPRQLIRT